MGVLCVMLSIEIPHSKRMQPHKHPYPPPLLLGLLPRTHAHTHAHTRAHTRAGALVPTEFWGFSGVSPNGAEDEPFLSWLYAVGNASDAEVPRVFSTSYGEDEGAEVGSHEAGTMHADRGEEEKDGGFEGVGSGCARGGGARALRSSSWQQPAAMRFSLF